MECCVLYCTPTRAVSSEVPAPTRWPLLVQVGAIPDRQVTAPSQVPRLCARRGGQKELRRGGGEKSVPGRSNRLVAIAESISESQLHKQDTDRFHGCTLSIRKDLLNRYA